MNKPPTIDLGSWITVGNHECVVTHLYEKKSPFGVCVVVFNKKKQPPMMLIGMEKNGFSLKEVISVVIRHRAINMFKNS